MDVLGLILMLAGSIMVYGARPILKAIKKENNDTDLVKLKSIGFLIVVVGALRIFDVF